MPTELKPISVPLADPNWPEVGQALYGAKQPDRIIETEKFWHNAAAVMFANGSVTAKEVAEAFGVTGPTVTNLMRQPWFQQKVTALMAAKGGRDVLELFREEALGTLATLVEIHTSTKCPAAARVASAREILDRAYGKAQQRVEVSNVPVSADPVAEHNRLLEENRRLNETA